MQCRSDTRMPILLLFGMLMGLFAAAGQAALPWAKSDERPTLAPMLKQVLPGVVNISTHSRIKVRTNPLFSDPFFRRFFDLPEQPAERETQSLGSGVIVDAEKGYVITNHHVIEAADRITVTLRDGRSFDAKLVGADPETDLAVLEIPAENLREVPLGDSSSLQVGDFVVAIGNPFGLGQTVTSGIVSALGRSGLGIEGYEDFIQTDASINPGNSGGALVDLDGRLIGINTAIVGPSGGNVGIGFAIPINMARAIMDQLIEFGEVRRGQLGVYIHDITPELAAALGLKEHTGALISQVIKGSPAEKGGLKAGDVVISVDGARVRNASQLRNAVGLLPIGTQVVLEVIRDGRTRTIEVTIAETSQPVADAGRFNEKLEGARLSEIAPDHPLAGRVEGVQVAEVEPGSPAWRAGLRDDDVIVSINRQPVHDLATARTLLRKAGGTLLLNILRGEGALFIVIR